MKPTPIKPSPLIQLPNGTWVRPEAVRSITPFKYEHSHRPRVVVCYGNNDHAVIFCEDFTAAQALADQLSAQVNAAA